VIVVFFFLLYLFECWDDLSSNSQMLVMIACGSSAKIFFYLKLSLHKPQVVVHTIKNQSLEWIMKLLA